MTDKYGRNIDYLRISITDKCNLRCMYCMLPQGISSTSYDSILKYEEILKIVEVGIELGINKVRITGGEPLLRKGVIELIKELGRLPEIKDISMTTNGVLLPKYAFALKNAGLSRVNISLDSLNSDTYKRITGRDEFANAIEGIKAAFEADLKPIKINVVVMKDINDNELKDFVNLTKEKDLHVRFVEYMPIGDVRSFVANYYISLNELKTEIIHEMDMVPANIKSCGPSNNYKAAGMKGTIGFITPISNNFCSECNRIRLSADGFLRPCLANDIEVDLHDKNGKIRKEVVREKFKEALKLKPKSHNFYKKNFLSQKNMFQIGG